MKISVIIPVYNVESFVERCVTSIMNQTYTEEVECIIVNDCTPDRSMEIVEKLIAKYNGPIQFKLLQHKYNRGLAAVRNTGMNAATGDYIIHIDSDDWCESDMLEKMYQKAVEEDADVVIADYFIDYSNDVIKYIKQVVTPDNILNIKKMLNGELGGYVWNKLIRADLLNKKQIQAIEGVDFGEDFIFSISLFSIAGKVVNLHKAFLHYCQNNPNSYCKSKSIKSINDSINSSLLIEKRIKEYGLINLCDKELYSKLLQTKLGLLINTKGRLRKKCNTSLLIKRRYIFTSTHIGYWAKICLWLASYRILWIFSPINFLVKRRNR